jgi:hypothetical protein
MAARVDRAGTQILAPIRHDCFNFNFFGSELRPPFY